MTAQDSTRSDYIQLVERFTRAFETEAAKRGTYPGLEWIEAERRAMTLHVLDEFRYRLLNQVGVREAVQRAEESACGHIDYGKKWAIGCADIVMTAARG